MLWPRITLRKKTDSDDTLEAVANEVMEAMPSDGDLAMSIEAIAKKRGRPIVTVEHELSNRGHSGMWIEAESVDYLVVDAGSAPARRAAIIYHELAHMVLDHRGPQIAKDPLLSAALAPDISPQISQRILQRDRYSDQQESEAETLGTLLAAEHRLRARRARWSRDILSTRLR